MKQLELKALIRAKKAYRHPAMGEISETSSNAGSQPESPTKNG